MFTEKESKLIVRVLSLLSRLPTSTSAFKRANLVQEVPRYKGLLRAFRLGFVFLELLTIIFTLPSTLATKDILNIVGHGSYVFLRAGFALNEVNLIFHDKDVHELISQTFKMNANFEAQLLEGKAYMNRAREFLFSFLLLMCITVATFSQMEGMFLTFWDLPFRVYPGSEALRGNIWLFVLITGVRGWFVLEEAVSGTLCVIGIFCMTSILFWLKKSW
jgi:hypothetical protein